VTELPSGTVTFLFTDIEGSTRLLQDLGDDYGLVARDHRRILREALGGHGGREVDTQGDAFFFSFVRARDAIAGAVAAQRAVAAHSWPRQAAVRVRMGIHTGEPHVGEEGYHGLDVVRAARICSAGNGGQILVSETTRALLGNALPEGVTVHDLGQQNLKDVQHERIFELVLDGQAGASQPLRTSEPGGPPPSRADALAASFERRIEDYVERQLEAALDPGRPPTRHGMGGLLVAAVALALLAAVVVGIVLLVRLL
jgi:class 3 adenylate cyclase